MDFGTGDILLVLAAFGLIVIGPLIFVFGIYTFNKRKKNE